MADKALAFPCFFDDVFVYFINSINLTRSCRHGLLRCKLQLKGEYPAPIPGNSFTCRTVMCYCAIFHMWSSPPADNEFDREIASHSASRIMQIRHYRQITADNDAIPRLRLIFDANFAASLPAEF